MTPRPGFLTLVLAALAGVSLFTAATAVIVAVLPFYQEAWLNEMLTGSLCS